MKKVAVVSHDAGGAEILSSWLKMHSYNYLTVIDGPALGIFHKKNLFNNNYTLEEAIFESEFVLTSTSWQSDIEKRAISLSRKMDKYVITILDHWVNYKDRFKLNSDIVLPNEIWVTDNYALNIAKGIFNDVKIKLIVNHHFSEIKKIIKEKSKLLKTGIIHKSKCKCLFLGENISEHAFLETGNSNGFGYDEIEALKYLLDNIEKIPIKFEELKIRPHPSEKENKYSWALKNNLVSTISNSNDLIDDLLESDVIFGCESIAMVIALIAKKKVISCIPNFVKKCSLPHSDILNLGDLIKSEI